MRSANILRETSNFVLTFPSDYPNDKDIQVILTNQDQANSVRVKLRDPNQNTEYMTLTLNPSESRDITIPASYRLGSTTGISQESIIVEADGPVAASTNNKGSCAAYLNLPREKLGRDYYVLTWWEGEQSGTALFVVTAGEEPTELLIRFSRSMKGYVTYKGVVYGKGSSLVVRVPAYGSFQILEKVDLSGAYIHADHPVSVLGGNIAAQVGEGPYIDNVLSEFPPIETWGTRFVSVPVPDDHLGGYIKLVAKDPWTRIQIDKENELFIQEAGGTQVLEVAAGVHKYLHADKPIMAVYFTKGDTSGEGVAYPASLLLPPLSQYLSDYPFSTFSDDKNDYLNHLLVVANKSTLTDLILDGEVVPLEGWFDIVGSDSLVARALEIDSGKHHLYHQTQSSQFAAYVYGLARDDCAYAFPAGMNLLNLTQSNQVGLMKGRDMLLEVINLCENRNKLFKSVSLWK